MKQAGIMTAQSTQPHTQYAPVADVNGNAAAQMMVGCRSSSARSPNLRLPLLLANILAHTPAYDWSLSLCAL